MQVPPKDSCCSLETGDTGRMNAPPAMYELAAAILENSVEHSLQWRREELVNVDVRNRIQVSHLALRIYNARLDQASNLIPPIVCDLFLL